MTIHVTVEHPHRAVAIIEEKWHCVKHLYTIAHYVLMAIL